MVLFSRISILDTIPKTVNFTRRPDVVDVADTISESLNVPTILFNANSVTESLKLFLVC